MIDASDLGAIAEEEDADRNEIQLVRRVARRRSVEGPARERCIFHGGAVALAGGEIVLGHDHRLDVGRRQLGGDLGPRLHRLRSVSPALSLSCLHDALGRVVVAVGRRGGAAGALALSGDGSAQVDATQVHASCLTEGGDSGRGAQILSPPLHGFERRVDQGLQRQGQKALGVVVVLADVDLAPQFILDSHHQLDGVEIVEADVAEDGLRGHGLAVVGSLGGQRQHHGSDGFSRKVFVAHGFFLLGFGPEGQMPGRSRASRSQAAGQCADAVGEVIDLVFLAQDAVSKLGFAKLSVSARLLRFRGAQQRIDGFLQRADGGAQLGHRVFQVTRRALYVEGDAAGSGRAFGDGLSFGEAFKNAHGNNPFEVEKWALFVPFELTSPGNPRRCRLPDQ